ncbi:uncharacterized protein LOC141674588 [Apium graveolens]|uniref:uncharacterized protein LOC141674588 n=1 Tax=Apium graveolens TaxID=4045 RepID=UPI003D796A93
MLKWAKELGQFDLEYYPRTTIKGQKLADFIIKFDSEVDDKAIVLAEPSSQVNAPVEVREEFSHPWWVLHVNGAVNNNGAGVRIVLVTLEGHHLMSAIHFKFYVTNNDTEYEALINSLKIALEVGVMNLITRSDSELVLNQVNGFFQARGPRTELYMRYVQCLLGKFGHAKLQGVLREENSNADALEKMGTLPEDKIQARRLRYRDVKYVEYDRVLYKRCFNQPLLRYVDLEEGNYIIREVHEGICGNHSGGGSLALKVRRQGYYWPITKEYAFKFVRAYDYCQRFANYSNAPATSITLLAEGMPLAIITARKINDFIFNSIVYRFGIPYKLISDNGKQFDNKELKKLCEDLNIKKDFTAVYHPQSCFSCLFAGYLCC